MKAERSGSRYFRPRRAANPRVDSNRSVTFGRKRKLGREMVRPRLPARMIAAGQSWNSIQAATGRRQLQWATRVDCMRA
jgi:hypothetical protein